MAGFINQGVDMQNPEAVQIMRRQQMAQQLLDQSQQPLQSQMISGHLVTPSWTQQLAKGLQGYLGNKRLGEADQQQQELAKRLRDQRQSEVGQFTQLLQGRPADQLPADQQGPVRSAQGPDIAGAYKFAANAQSPELQQFGMQGALSQAQEQAKLAQQQAMQQKLVGMLQSAKTPQEAISMGVPPEMVKNYYESGNWGKEKGVAVNGQLVDPRTGAPIGQAIPKQLDPSSAKLIQDADGNWIPNPAMVKYEQQTAPLKAPKVQVSVNEGQKGFDNESKLRLDFKSEPIYKDYADMKSAYGQIKTSLKKESPIGDVAAATKIMKLLDPGSVVRESELGIAMAATGKMDRLQNFVDMWSSGKKLTPSQRTEFGSLADELFNVAGKVYNDTRSNYEQQGRRYNLNTDVLGAPHNMPSNQAAPGVPSKDAIAAEIERRRGGK